MNPELAMKLKMAMSSLEKAVDDMETLIDYACEGEKPMSSVIDKRMRSKMLTIDTGSSSDEE